MGREGRHVSLPAGHGTTWRADVVSRRRPRPGGASAALALAGRGKDAFRSYSDHLREAGSEGADYSDEQFASRNSRGYSDWRVELRRIFRAALVSGSGKLRALRGSVGCG